jgi:hypothetical protein
MPVYSIGGIRIPVYSVWESHFPPEAAEEGRVVTEAIWRDMTQFAGHIAHEDRSAFKDRAGPLLARPILSRAGFDEKGVLVVDSGERAEPTHGRRHRHLPHHTGLTWSAPEADCSVLVHARHRRPRMSAGSQIAIGDLESTI